MIYQKNMKTSTLKVQTVLIDMETASTMVTSFYPKKTLALLVPVIMVPAKVV